MMTGYWVSQALYVAAKLGIADLLADGPRPVEDLAATTHTDAPSLRRVLRALRQRRRLHRSKPGRLRAHPARCAAADRDARLHACTRHHVR